MKTKSILFGLSLLLIAFVSCSRNEMTSEESIEKSLNLSNRNRDSLVIDTVVDQRPTINATIFTTGTTCFSLASGYGNDYRYYVSSNTAMPYDRLVYSTAIKGNALFAVQSLVIPAYQYVSQNVVIFNNESSKVGDVIIRVLSVKNNTLETINEYNKIDI